MRLFAIALAIVILVLAALSAAPAAWLAPYAQIAATLPVTIAVVALVLVLALIFWRPKVAPARTPAPAIVPVAAPPPAVAAADAEVVSFLGLLQEKGRLVDFLMDDIAAYSDAEVGAAGRVLHQGCKAALREHFGIRPLRDESEGSKVVVPTGYAADEYRLVGRVAGEAPFTGTLVHHGWKAEWVKLPRLIANKSDRPPILAPAEVELP